MRRFYSVPWYIKAFYIPFYLSVASVIASEPVNSNEAIIVRHITPPANPIYSKGYSYFLDILHLAFKKVGQPYVLKPVEAPLVPDSRSLLFLKQDRYDVMWMHTNTLREQELRPIRIPVFRGLIGWRLLFINKNTAKFFNEINADTIKVLYGGLGHDWPDVAIMKYNDYAVRTSINWRGVVSQLEQQRVDYFSRAINEIWREQIEMQHNQIVIDQRFALQYKSASYLFVSKKNEKLAKIIENGLEMAVADGSFQRLFFSYYGNNILRSNLLQREILKLENPSLPPQTPVERKELWFSIDEISTIPAPR